MSAARAGTAVSRSVDALALLAVATKVLVAYLELIASPAGREGVQA